VSAGAVPLGGTEHKEADLAALGQALGAGESHPPTSADGATSDLSLDEILLLHSVGLEPVHVVFGIGCISILSGVWNWTTGPVTDAHDAFHRALDEAKESIRSQAQSAGAVGVLGVEVEPQVSYYRYTVVVTGTAVRPFTDDTGASHFNVHYRSPFLCDLSARDFAVLSLAGWYPLDLVAGASYVHAPRRTLGTAIGQSTQNVELTNFTETLYQAREAAMEEMQSHITQAGGTGLVDATVIDRPVYFAHHVVEFLTYGTAIKMLAKEHTHPNMAVVLPVDDRVRTFEATSLD
jgi:uncharacterized protein YbjQ (UPF0145 family)